MKIDISVSRKMTINTGNYSSVSPAVTMTAKDVDVHLASEVYMNLADMVDGFVTLETRDLFSAQEGIQEISWANYIEHINTQGNRIMESIHDAAKQLEELSGDNSNT